jgi:molybdopterin/thiamine biosynthesis adenylyltransferase
MAIAGSEVIREINHRGTENTEKYNSMNSIAFLCVLCASVVKNRSNHLTHLVQVGAGSGGMTVLDILCRDPRITHVSLIEPDVYKPHNVVRHQFPLPAVGKRKADLAAEWLRERRPDLLIDVLACDLLDPVHANEIESAVQNSDLGICAADNEAAKFHWDALMRRHRKPWTLGEVLSGGIGGFVHWFVPGGPCYGCVASFLRRSVTVDQSKPPDYSLPGGPAPETTIPASRASIEVIASLHAQITLQLLTHSRDYAPGFTSLLFTLEKVPGIFDEAFRAHRFRIPRSPECLICREDLAPQNLDQALDDALARLNQP